MPLNKFPENDLIQAQETVLAKMLYNLLVDAVNETAAIKEKAVGTEAKVETPAFDRAISFMDNLDKQIQLMPAGLPIKKDNILNHWTVNLTLLINHHSHVLFAKMIAHNVTPNSRDLYSTVRSSNLLAFRTLKGNMSTVNRYELLKSALGAREPHLTENQSQIVSDILLIYDTQSFIKDEHARDLVALAMWTLSPNIVRNILALFPKNQLRGYRILSDFMKHQMTPDNKESLKQIFIDVLNYFLFDFNETRSVFIEACNVKWSMEERDIHDILKNKIINLHTKDYMSTSVLIDLIRKNPLTANNQDIVKETFLTLLEVSNFHGTSEVLQCAIENNYVIDALDIIRKLTHSEDAFQVIIKDEVHRVLKAVKNSSTFIVSSDKTPSQMIKQLMETGAKLNPNFKDGCYLLKSALECRDLDLLETILSSCFFYPDQLTFVLNAPQYHGLQQPSAEMECKQILLLVKYGADFHRCFSPLRASLCSIRNKLITSQMRNTVNPSQVSINDAAIQALDDLILQIFKTGLAPLTEQPLKECFINFIVMNEFPDQLCAYIIKSFLDLGVDPACLDSDGNALVSHLVASNKVLSLGLVLHEQRKRENALNNLKFYYQLVKSSENNFTLTCSFANDKDIVFPDKAYKTSNDYFLLAKGCMPIMKLLMAYDCPLSNDTLALYESLILKTNSDNQSIFTQDDYEILKKYQTPMSLHSSSLMSQTPDEKEAQELSIIRKKPTKKIPVSFDTITKMDCNDFLLCKTPSTLTQALNCVLDHEIANYSEVKGDGFKETVEFIAKLKKYRFDYVAILTDKTDLPLRHLAKNVCDTNITYSIIALQILLFLAPFLQLKALKDDSKTFDKLKANLPKLFKTYLDAEYDKQRADMADLVFYLKSRSENPDTKFDERVPVFLDLVLGLDCNPQRAGDYLEKSIEIGKSFVFFNNQTTRIMQAMQTEQAKPHTEPSYAAHLRFSFARDMREPAITYAIDSIRTVGNLRK